MMAQSSRLEVLPTELKLAVLNQLSDVKSLSALVHASPIFHKVYSLDRELILTKITIRELRNRPNSVDILRRTSLSSVTMTSKALDKNLELAIASARTQVLLRGQ